MAWTFFSRIFLHTILWSSWNHKPGLSLLAQCWHRTWHLKGLVNDWMEQLVTEAYLCLVCAERDGVGQFSVIGWHWCLENLESHQPCLDRNTSSWDFTGIMCIKQEQVLKVPDYSWATFYPALLRKDMSGEMGVKKGACIFLGKSISFSGALRMRCEETGFGAKIQIQDKCK